MKVGDLLFERFRITRFLGSGGVSEVYLAEDEILGEAVALKVIHPRHARDPEVVRRFRREVEICRLVAHPSVVSIRELYEESSSSLLCLSMEYLPGGDLESRVRRHGPLSEPELLAIGDSILGALEAAHSAGVIHRDVKPHNILFSASGEAKLADFGLARVGARDALQGGESAAGTPEYCPPECASGRYVDGRGDLYSLGATLYEAAVGRPPFSANSPMALLAAKLRDRAPRVRDARPELSPACDSAIARALESDPELRFQTAAEFRAALRSPNASSDASLEEAASEDDRFRITCPSCGRSLSRSLPYCFRCGCSLPAVAPAKAGQAASTVVVLGAGKSGDKLRAQDRDACLAIVRRRELDVSSLENKLPRFPFKLAKGLSPESARSIASSLSAAGIPAAVSARGNKAENAIVRKAFRGKIGALGPRMLVIIACVLGSQLGGISNLARAIDSKSYGLALLALFLLVIIAPFCGVAIGNGTTYARLDGDSSRSYSWSLLGLAKDLRGGALREIAESLGRKLDTLSERLGPESGLDARSEAGLAASVDGSLAEWSSLARSAQGLELALSGAEDSSAPIDAFDRRETELELDAIYGRLLRFSSALDALNLKLLALRSLREDEKLGELARASAELADLAEARRELGLSLEGGVA